MQNKTKYSILLLISVYLSGCAIGRSWDIPSNTESNISVINNKKIHIYADENIELIKNAFDYELKNNMSEYISIQQIEEQEVSQYPFLLIKIEEPKWSDDLISYSSYLSVFTFSIIPGYTNKYSKIDLTLISKDIEGTIISQNKSYTAKRHYISWLPLIVYPNYGSDMANGWGTLNSGFQKAHVFYIREFLLENIDILTLE
jgi:hypothetical protein